jgi:polyhydroxyalkanoate synthesis regulator phasin
MKNLNIKNKIITGVLLVSIMIAGGTAVFAVDLTSKSGDISVDQHQDRNQNGVRFKTNLDNLVTAGIITSDQEAAINEVLIPQGMNKDSNSNQSGNSEDRQNILKTRIDALAAAGTITADEQTAIETALANSNGDFKAILDNLIASGLLTSDRSLVIGEALISHGINKDGDSNQAKNPETLKTRIDTLAAAGTITAGEQTAIETALANSNEDFKTLLDNLVTSGSLTSDRALVIGETLISQDMNKDRNSNQFENSEDRQNMLKTRIDTLVTAGTITADQETAVLEALTSK